MALNRNNVRIRREGILTIVDGIKMDNWFIDINDDIATELRNKEAIILRGVFSKDFMADIKKLVVNHHFKANNYQDCGNGLPGNMYRLDNLQKRDFAARFIQLYCFAFWDKDTPDVILRLMRSWGRLVNKIRGFDPGSQFDTKEEFVWWLNAYHYPSTGFVGRHHKFGIQNYINNKVPFTESVAVLSKLGEDFQRGGLYFGKRGHDDSEMHYVEPYLGWGDVLLFANDLHHEIKPIDPDKPVDMDPMKNRFILDLTSVSMEAVHKYFSGK